MKRLIALLLALALTLSVIPVSAMPVFAEELVQEEPAETAVPTEEVAEATEAVEVVEPTEAVEEPTEEVVEPTEEAVDPTEEPLSREDVPTRATVYKSGTWGSNLSWTIYSDGILEISGTGEMANMGSYDAPWRNYTSKFDTVVVCEGVTSVEKYAFQDNTYLKTVTLADSVTALEERAFYDCTKLTSIDLGGVTAVGERTFYGCEALQTVNMEHVTSFGEYAFGYCEKLTEIIIPEGTTSVTDNAFRGCYAATRIELPDTLTTIGVSAFQGCSAAEEILIPDSVTTIGASAFKSCSSATRIVIGDGVTATGSQAFYGCKALEELVIGNNVELIGNGAFYECEVLKEVYIPDSVTEIQSSAFYGGESITDVYLGSGLREEYCIATEAFKYCSAIENVWYRGTQEQWTTMNVFGSSYQGTQYLAEANRHYMMGSCGDDVQWDIAFDGTMTVSGTGPMYDYSQWDYEAGTKAKKLVVEPGITAIGEMVFGWMESLTEVVLPEGLTKIGASAFYHCEKLETVKLPSTLSDYGYGAFYGCVSIDGIWAAEDSEYFYNDSKGVLFSADGALMQIPSGLAGTYDIPAGTTQIAPYAFADCTELETVTFPASVTTICESAFFRSSLTSVSIPDTVTEIQPWAFYWSYALQSVRFPESITRIEEGVFGECYGLTEIVIPDHITEISNEAFWNCFNVTSVTIPDSVTYIGDYAFSWLWALETVTIPDSVTYLGMGAFDECIGLKSVNLGTGLTTLEESTFSGCAALEEVYIPKNITTIVAGAFNGCESLHTVWYNSTEAEWNIIDITNQGNEYLQGVQIHFLKDQGSCGAGVNWRVMQDGSLIIFGSGAMDDYTETAAPWAEYAKEIEALQVADGVTSVGTYAFANLTDLVYAELRDDVATIGEGAFSGCSALPVIGLPESVTSIGADAFSGCSSLEEVYLPSQLTSIGDNAFYGCAKLSGVELPAALTQIGAGAFSGCKALTAISIPAAVSSIGENAFNGCTALANITVAEENTAYCTDEQGVLFNKEKTELLLAPVTLSGSYTVPAGVAAIAANAFPCKELTALTLPASLQNVGQNAFLSCRKLTSVRYYDNAQQWAAISVASGNDRLLNAKITFTQASGSCGENLTWEMESGGLLIISGSGTMYDYALESAPWAEYAASIRTLKLSEGITSIGSGAFRDFTALTSLEIPHSVTSIGAEAFAGCKNLITLSLGNGVTSVGSEAFLGCNSLKSVSVGTGLAVNSATFANCGALEAIEIDPMNPYCKSVDGLVYSPDGTELVVVPMGCSGSITLPAGVKVIGSHAFENSGLSSVTLPEGVTTVEEWAFINAHIKEVNFPDTLTEIGMWAFGGTKLQSVMLPGSITSIGLNAFHGCGELISVTLPEGLSVIEMGVFGECFSLKTVTVPASVTEIGMFAFDECTALTTVFWQGTAEAFGNLVVDSFNEPFTSAMIVVDQQVSILAAPNAATGKPQLTWEAVEGVTKYEVHRATAIDGKYKKLKAVSGTTYTDTSASAGKEYYYKIKALYGKSAVEIGTAVAGCVLAQPKVKVSVNASTGLPTLSWSKISGAYRYVILRAEKAATYDNEYIELAVQKGTSFTDKTAQADKVYYYKVLVTSSKENADCIRPAPVRVVTGIAKPAIKVTANENGKPQITCQELPGAVSYTLYRSTSKKGTYTQLQVSSEPFFVDDFAEVGKTYYYKLSAAGNNSESAMSGYDDVRCVAVSPEITVIRSDATGKAVISWSAIDGAKKYEIYRSTKEGSGYKKIATTDKLSYQDTGASVGKTYYYQVYTVPASSKAKSMPSNIGSVYTICAQPVLKVSYSASGQHTISWSKVSGAKTYEIWRGDAENGVFIRLANQKGTSYTDKDTQPDSLYYYYVNAIASKPENDSIEADPVMIARAVVAPKISVSNNLVGKPVITWDAVEGALRYKIYRATSSKGEYTLVGNVTGTSFTNERVDIGTCYYYKVTALGKNSESPMSNCEDTYAKLPAPEMTGGEQDLASGKPVIRWNTVDGASKYDVYRATEPDGKYKKIASGIKLTNYTDKDAKNSTTYYYKVVSVASNTKVNSSLSDWYSVTSGNISAADAKVRAILIKIERYPSYLAINADILRSEVALYRIAGDSNGVILDMMDNVAECRNYISKIKSACGDNRSLYMLVLECKSADAPIWGGNDSKYANAVESFATDCDHIVSMYNIICRSYGLPTVD